MLSVLIPVYNWDVTDLVNELHRQCLVQNIDFEILALDDCSPNILIKNTNSKIKLGHFKLIELDKNAGNAEARNILARNAEFNWLLFLDADMIPAKENFIQRYLEQIQFNDFDIMSGGILYESNVAPEFRLKWLHGKKTEEQIKDKDPYLEIRGNNFLIRKPIFLANPFGGLPENYGYVDTYFGLKLKQAKARVKIIDNPCYHLGLETNFRFIEKHEKALRNAHWMMKNQPETAENLRVIKIYKRIKNLGLEGGIRKFYLTFRKNMLDNLLSENPSLFVFQLYKLGYICTLKDE